MPFRFNPFTGKLDVVNTSGGTITGLDTQVLFFDGDDNPAGDPGLTYDKNTNTLNAINISGFITNPLEFLTPNGAIADNAPNMSFVAGNGDNGNGGLGASMDFEGGKVLDGGNWEANSGTGAVGGGNGGNMTFNVGPGQGGGTNGVFRISNGGSEYGTLDFESLTGDHIYTFQDGDGTLAFLSDIPSVTNFATKALDNLASVAINTSLLLGASDGGALGSTSKMWSDLFLADGGVINWNNGNATLTHSTSLLTSNVDVVVPDEVYGVAWNGSFEVPTKNAVYDKIQSLPTPSSTRAISIVLYNGGSDLTTGIQDVPIIIPYAGTVTGWEIMAYDSTNTLISTSCVIDILSDTFANLPLSGSDSIAGSDKPTLSSQSTASDNSVSWSTLVLYNYIQTEIESINAGVARIVISIKVTT